MTMGGREPLHAEYSAGFTAEGTMDSLTMGLHMDSGYFVGDTSGDITMATGWSDNVYYTEHFTCTGDLFKTPTPHNTSMRAPGVIQSLYVHEAAVEHAAFSLGLPMHVVQEKNFYQVGQTTPYKDHIGSPTYNWTIPTLWAQCKKDAEFEKRRAAVEVFNKANLWRKRGIALTPVKYVMGLTYYKSGAVVNIYSVDGTVEVAVGGVELGQGLATKVAQVAAYTLGVPLDMVIVSPTDTSKVSNNTSTGGSGTSECSAQAARLACEELKQRLAPYTSQKGASWVDACGAAATAGVPLVASSWYDAEAHGNANSYATYGVACSECEVDVLTGEVQVLRADIHMDLGLSLNAGLDIGQVEGGFVMSLGYVFTEQVLLNDKHEQLNLGTWEYKVPSAFDIPIELNVSLLPNTPNPAAEGCMRSKASAEPSMPTALSAVFAVKQAIYAARADGGLKDHFQLDLPVTVEAISQACAVDAARFKLA